MYVYIYIYIYLFIYIFIYLPGHFLGCSHIAVSRAPISQISARVIKIHRLKSFSVDCQ